MYVCMFVCMYLCMCMCMCVCLFANIWYFQDFTGSGWKMFAPPHDIEPCNGNAFLFNNYQFPRKVTLPLLSHKDIVTDVMLLMGELAQVLAIIPSSISVHPACHYEIHERQRNC